MMRLPDDAHVSTESWDEVIGCIKARAPVRVFTRFAIDAENSDSFETLSGEKSL